MSWSFQKKGEADAVRAAVAEWNPSTDEPEQVAAVKALLADALLHPSFGSEIVNGPETLRVLAAVEAFGHTDVNSYSLTVKVEPLYVAVATPPAPAPATS